MLRRRLSRPLDADVRRVAIANPAWNAVAGPDRAARWHGARPAARRRSPLAEEEVALLPPVGLRRAPWARRCSWLGELRGAAGPSPQLREAVRAARFDHPLRWIWPGPGCALGQPARGRRTTRPSPLLRAAGRPRPNAARTGLDATGPRCAAAARARRSNGRIGTVLPPSRLTT